jgi:hypothetical protein
MFSSAPAANHRPTISPETSQVPVLAIVAVVGFVAVVCWDLLFLLLLLLLFFVLPCWRRIVQASRSLGKSRCDRVLKFGSSGTVAEHIINICIATRPYIAKQQTEQQLHKQAKQDHQQQYQKQSQRLLNTSLNNGSERQSELHIFLHEMLSGWLCS